MDRESLGALANAIAEFEGGVVIISHNDEFVSTLCPEEWVMDAGHLTTKGEAGWMSRQDDKISDQQVITEMTDALGNTTEVKAPKKKLSKRDEKAAIKIITKKIKDGEELDEDEVSALLPRARPFLTSLSLPPTHPPPLSPCLPSSRRRPSPSRTA